MDMDDVYRIRESSMHSPVTEIRVDLVEHYPGVISDRAEFITP